MWIKKEAVYKFVTSFLKEFEVCVMIRPLVLNLILIMYLLPMKKGQNILRVIRLFMLKSLVKYMVISL